MDSIESYLRKMIVASVGAADLGCEKLGKLIDECVARGEVTVEKGRGSTRSSSAPASRPLPRTRTKSPPWTLRP